MTPKVIVVGGLAVVLFVISVVVFLPWAIFRPTPTLKTDPYTPIEKAGREIYVSQGCVYCHTQFTRPLDVTPSEPSEAGQYVYGKPHQLGTARTGPDLSNIGLKRGDEWEKAHLFEPRHYTPNSIMPSFTFLKGQTVKASDGKTYDQADAVVAYLNTLGNKSTASTDLMIKEPYTDKKNPFPVTKENWAKGRVIYAQRCFTCHGCAGKGDGPYAMINNARPADLRQQRYFVLPDSFDFWRVSEGVPGTVMPIWKLSLTDEERWLVALYVKHAYMDMVPHYTDEGDLPKAYDLANPTTPKKSTSPTESGQASVEDINIGKTLYTANCSPCHGYSGHGDGPNAVGTPLYPGLLPMPPDFSDPGAPYGGWAWGDFYWRISESIPLRPMMPWKEMWPGPDGSPGSLERWYLSDFVRGMLMFPNDKNEPDDADTPPKYEPLKMPANADAVNGRLVYFKRCWLCHGVGGQGDGQKGQNLRPTPANFTDPDVAKMKDGRWFWRVSQGVKNAAMPVWHVLLSDGDMWDAIAYIKVTYVFPGAAAKANGLTLQYDQLQAALKEQNAGNVEFQALTSPYDPTKETVADGQAIYAEYCAECHGAKFTGDGAIGKKLSPRPTNLVAAAKTQDLKLKTADNPTGARDYWYRMIAEGKPGTSMGQYRQFLADKEIWSVLWWTRQQIVGEKPEQ